MSVAVLCTRIPVCEIRASYPLTTMLSYLALSGLVRLDAVSSLCHGFIYHADRIRALLWINAFLSNQRSELFSQRRYVVLALFFAHL